MSLCRPYLLLESEVAAQPGRLDEAWRAAATFAFVADRSGVATGWIEEKLAALPPDLHEYHFVLLTSGSTGMIVR